jgi:glycosyltransferase involved in cell wall biosynthesis
MHVILMCGPTNVGESNEGNITVYPTNSVTKLSRFFDALKVGGSIQHVDVVSAQDPFETALVAWRLARRYRAALHVQVHTDFMSPAYAAHSLINRVRVYIARFILKRADRVRVVSNHVRDSVLALGVDPTKVSVLPIYIDMQRFKNATVPAEIAKKYETFSLKVLVVSRLEPEKNVSLAIRTFAENAPKDACLIILGQGSELTVLERLVTKLNMDSRVFFEPWQDPAPYYKMANLLLVTSEYEGYGQVIVEALAAGLPVLATEVGVAQEVGAMTAPTHDFAPAFSNWVANGPRTMSLQNYPYASQEEYVRMYCEDIAAAKRENVA